MPEITPFGAWASPITAVLAASGAVRIGGLALDGDDIYWLEGRPADQGRNVVVRMRASGLVEDVTAPPLNVRSRVHEYGGGAFAVAAGTLFFVEDADQRVWRRDPDGAPRPLTPEGPGRHADLVVDPARPRLVCVREDHGMPGEPCNTLVAIPLAGGAPEVLAAGADFHASPCFDGSGQRLAFLRWNHPNMPWQGTELWLAPVAADGTPGPAMLVAGGPDESIFQPAFSPDGVLHFVSDRGGWWNLYRWRDGVVEPVWQENVEIAVPQWLFGLSTYGWVDPSTIAYAFVREGLWHLGMVDTTTGVVTGVPTTLTEIAHLRAVPGRAVFVGASAAESPALWELATTRLSAGRELTAVGPRRLHQPSPARLDTAMVSRPVPVSFSTAGGAIAHALHYPPHNPAYQAPAGERPPLIVVSHGGPTWAASSALSLVVQFWTSRGFAILDVNYRGSTGYGRAYRQALDGVWGIADVEDCTAGARHLVERGLADPARLAIRGSSAGGYTTLAALTFTDLFRAGASYYGVGDLETLAKDTHKFESRYLETLIGPYPARIDLYHARSPLHHVDRLRCPVIFFQGLEDKVVPPAQAERMVAALTAKGVPAPHLVFPGEQHGFRRAETVARALEAELAFYRRVLALPEVLVGTLAGPPNPATGPAASAPPEPDAA
jgi:dipeptidyl aminopeptidase/acylaminoacyl peptidase